MNTDVIIALISGVFGSGLISIIATAVINRRTKEREAKLEAEKKQVPDWFEQFRANEKKWYEEEVKPGREQMKEFEANLESFAKESREADAKLAQKLDMFMTVYGNNKAVDCRKYLLEAESTVRIRCREAAQRSTYSSARDWGFSQEWWDNILERIDGYNKYCKEHPEFPNTKCEGAIAYLKSMYAQWQSR